MVAAMEICSKSKNKSFQTYVSTLQYDTPIKTVWSKIKSFKSNYVQQTYPITMSNVMITDLVDKANVLAKFFSSISRCGIHKTPIDINNIIDTAKKMQNNKDYYKQIELFELEDALAKSRDSSPGRDHIRYFLLRALPMKTKLELLSIYNQSFQQ